jgi:DNA-binding IclR family transcriptional regulator
VNARAASDVESSGREGSSTILTVDRGIQVLRAFRANRAPLSNAEIVRRTGLSKATVSRLTTTLMQLGYLRHVPGGREFELGAGPLSIGHAFLEASPLLRAAEPFVQELADRLNVSVALGIGDHLEMLYIAYGVSHRISTLRMGVGSLLPMGKTAIGHAWLWGLPPARQKECIAALRRDAGNRGAALDRSIRESFDDLESTGVCAVIGLFQRDAFAVALPVHLGRQRVPMALSCGVADVEPKLPAFRKRIAPELRKAAAQFEKLLEDLDGDP